MAPGAAGFVYLALYFKKEKPLPLIIWPLLLFQVIALVLAFQSSGISGPILLPAAFREEGLSTHSSDTLPPAWAGNA